MIISHRHRFIFIKTQKTAGTSLEIALSKYLGPEDVLTPTDDEDEELREQLGYAGPRNYRVPWRRYTLRDWRTFPEHRGRMTFFTHATAPFIWHHIPRDVWDGYYKFAFERNPFEQAISLYYWHTRRRDPRPSISEWIAGGGLEIVPVPAIYRLNGAIAVDDVFRYEELGASVERIRERLGLPEPLELPRAKSSERQDRRPYQEVLSAADRAAIESRFAETLATFGYGWSEEAGGEPVSGAASDASSDRGRTA
jgi:hypothetical protein